LTVFSVSQIGPMLSSADPDSNLPPCCRRDGKHHCSMMVSRSHSSSGPLLQTSRCPSFPTIRVVPSNRLVSLTPDAGARFAHLIVQSASLHFTQPRCRTPFSRTRQKRGPPDFAS
jgi:hypothetical protein